MSTTEFDVHLERGPVEAGTYTAVLKNRQDNTQETVAANSPEELKNAVLEKAERKQRHTPAQKRAAENKLNEMVTDLRRGGRGRSPTEEEGVPTEGWHCACWWIFCACYWAPW
jgi:hypothetical protein